MPRYTIAIIGLASKIPPGGLPPCMCKMATQTGCSISELKETQMANLETQESAKPRLANPGPLGLAGFGLTTVVLCTINTGILPKEAIPVVVPLAFAYGGVAQIIAGILEFRTENTFGMVAFTSYGLFWWWFAFLQWTIGAGWLKAPP